MGFVILIKTGDNMSTQTIQLTSIPVQASDGTKSAVVSSGPPFLYGFGDQTPTSWHLAEITSEPWIFSTDFGALYLKSFTGETYNVTLSLGV